MDFIFGLTPYEHAAVARSEAHDIQGVAVRFASVEDLVILKVIAGRPRDIEDVEGVLAKRKNLDSTLIKKVLAEFAQELGTPLVETFEGLFRKSR